MHTTTKRNFYFHFYIQRFMVRSTDVLIAPLFFFFPFLSTEVCQEWRCIQKRNTEKSSLIRSSHSLDVRTRNSSSSLTGQLNID
jgi:hypothetical protein